MTDDTNRSAARAPDIGDHPTGVNIPGSTRMYAPDGSYVVTGPHGESYHVNAGGDITGTVPAIRRVQIEDLSLVVRHDIANVFDTVSHTLHFVGGGVFSYLHRKAGEGMNIETRNVTYRALEDGVFVVCCTAVPEGDAFST